MFLCIMLVGGSRFMVRAYTERAHRYELQKNTLIVGAGNAGAAIARELRLNSALDTAPSVSWTTIPTSSASRSTE